MANGLGGKPLVRGRAHAIWSVGGLENHHIFSTTALRKINHRSIMNRVTMIILFRIAANMVEPKVCGRRDARRRQSLNTRRMIKVMVACFRILSPRLKERVGQQRKMVLNIFLI